MNFQDILLCSPVLRAFTKNDAAYFLLLSRHQNGGYSKMMKQFSLKEPGLRQSSLIIADHDIVSEDILFLYRTKGLWPRNQLTADSKSHSQKYCEYVTHILLTDYLLQQRCTV